VGAARCLFERASLSVVEAIERFRAALADTREAILARLRIAKV